MIYDDLNLPPPPHPEFNLQDQTLLELEAQQALIRQGDISHSIYWLEKGLVRAVFSDDTGKEFFWEGDIIFQPRSLLTDEPLPYSMLALEACRYRQLSIERYLEFVRTDPQWQQYHQRILTLHLINRERKEEFLLLNSPEKRVIRFNQNFAWLIKRVPDYILASYLGMTPISYSRIKKRLGLSS